MRIGGFPRNAGRLAVRKPPADAAPVVGTLTADDIVDDPRGPTHLPPAHDGEDPGFTPEPIEEEAPVRTTRLAPPPRPVPTFMGDLPADAAPTEKRAPPAPVRPSAFPRTAAVASKPGTNPFAALNRKCGATPPAPPASAASLRATGACGTHPVTSRIRRASRTESTSALTTSLSESETTMQHIAWALGEDVAPLIRYMQDQRAIYCWDRHGRGSDSTFVHDVVD